MTLLRAGKRHGSGLDARRVLGNDGPCSVTRLCELCVGRRIHAVDAAPEHRDRCPSHL